ncbi:class I SAM-dependent methyltransferase [Nostoc sp. FACHB-133]|uniref:class I SAM-dependent methyltransferase n=1 Tax=Nostoc sp. FACHB-133 TaxID=2692835 RepID=UPI0016883ABC|nr:class I SAM-dependent methyltransferase [Nostoc sp. FACHB-133]MBD2527592.1 class I SAM-dependent methyltransferase [Nostoc sp. FACHB-133]
MNDVPKIKDEVCRTALIMATKRAIEADRPDHLFDDPLAAQLAGETGQAWREKWEQEDSDNPLGSTLRIQFVAVRTRFFDDFILSVLPEVKQLVFLGVGLDTRAFRLPFPPQTRLYELDLPELIQYREAILQDKPANCLRQAIAGDLTQPWSHLLLQQSFDINIPTLWLMEGLLMYLNEAEVNELLKTISQLSTDGSHLGADLVSVKSWQVGTKHQNGLISKHWRFGTDEPENLFAAHGWNVSVIQPGEIRANYGRYAVKLTPREIKGVRRSFLVTARKESITL